MGSLTVESQSVMLDDVARLDSVVEEFQVKALVAQFAVHRLAFAILPGRAGLDVKSLHLLLAEPGFEVVLHELRSVVTAQERRGAVLLEQAPQDLLHVFGGQRGRDLDGVALSCELVTQAQQLKLGPASALVVDEVIAPDMTRIKRLLRHFWHSVLEARPGLFAGWHLAFGLLPQAVHALNVDWSCDPSRHKSMDTPIAIARVLMR